MSDEFLDKPEVRKLTQRAHLDDQLAVLDREGIPYKVVGRAILVSRHHVRAWLCGQAVAPSRGPNMNAILR